MDTFGYDDIKVIWYKWNIDIQMIGIEPSMKVYTICPFEMLKSMKIQY